MPRLMPVVSPGAVYGAHGLGLPARQKADMRASPRLPLPARRRKEAERPPCDSAAHRCRSHLSRQRCRSEEHTSELQSPCNLVCRLLLEKKKKNTNAIKHEVK